MAQVPGIVAHWSAGPLQASVGPGVQAPLRQVSFCVQAFPSSQVVPVNGVQVPVVAEQVVQIPHAEPMFCQAPAELQLCGCVPLHRVAPGAQAPEHVPPPQTNGQAEPVLCQAPVASQVCG